MAGNERLNLKKVDAILKPSGFTLIEVLIVVIIVAILAALIMPRLLSQPEKAYISEANQMLGAIFRAENYYVESGTGNEWLPVDATAGNFPNWEQIRVQVPDAKNFVYACTTAMCTATRVAGPYKGNVISVPNASPSYWNCSATPGESKSYVTNPSGGCLV